MICQYRYQLTHLSINVNVSAAYTLAYSCLDRYEDNLEITVLSLDLNTTSYHIMSADGVTYTGKHCQMIACLFWCKLLSKYLL